jgi:16S rRNA (guanine527-N7)-methyltransferase
VETPSHSHVSLSIEANSSVSVDLRQIEDQLLAAGIRGLPSAAGQQFLDLMNLLLRWNARLNLTAIRTPEEILRRHFIEGAFVAQNLPEELGTLLDFGSGAGFPGIPIAICRPGLRVTLAESQAKKAAFLREAVRVLGISAEVYHGRVESLPPDTKYGVVTLRAVDKMQEAIQHARSRSTAFLAVMTTRRSAPQIETLVPDLVWREPVALPDSSTAVLLLGAKA